MEKYVRIFEMRDIDGQIRMMHMLQKDIELHCHAFFELVYVVSGSATHHFDGTVTQISKGDYFIIDPGRAHCYRDINGFEIINCIFLPEYIDRALLDCPSLSEMLSNRVLRFGVPVDIRTANRLFHDNDGSVGRIIKNMVKEHTAKNTGYMELLRCQLTQILVCAVRATEQAEATHQYHNATKAIADYLCENYAKPLSLKNLSGLVGYTPQYISGLFSRDTGMSIQAFLQQKRIQEACRLLEKTQLRLTDIAQSVGYSDAKHFSRVFTRYKGVSPREYRSTVI